MKKRIQKKTHRSGKKKKEPDPSNRVEAAEGPISISDKELKRLLDSTLERARAITKKYGG